jgi:hypothetical protein
MRSADEVALTLASLDAPVELPATMFGVIRIFATDPVPTRNEK